jgi:hypothetical protein
MEQRTGRFALDTLLPKKIEKRRREARDARIPKRLSGLLWLNKGYSPEEVADLLDVCPRTVRHGVALFHEEGLDALCTLAYKGDPG